MPIYFEHLVASNCGRDGVSIEGDVDVSFGKLELNNIGRDGVHISPSKQDLIAAGISPDVPAEVIEEAKDALKSVPLASKDDQEKIIRESRLIKFISVGANLATIASLILQIA
ncbi:TPA: hypothetical protein QIT10_003590 [Enterobacter bugandensis]|nr:hypothetical protein [Enterobacter bugandensis]HEP0376161.1 hypothetical protein [Enterobacter bugandensis]